MSSKEQDVLKSEVQRTILKVQQSIKKNRESQLFYKAFLKPIEIALKTYDTQNKNIVSQKAKNKQYGCLPFGLKQVIKTNIDQNKNVLVDFENLDVKMQQKRIKKNVYNISDVREHYCDNLLSLMKPNNQNQHGLKVAICICMYSQDKSMLKRTLAGVSQNILTFKKNGIPQSKIGVFVIMDGIQPVEETVEQLFEELQKDSNIFLNDDVDITDARDLINQQRQIQDQQVQNLNHLIFDDEELEDRKSRRFKQRRKYYKLYKKMIKDIQKLEKQKILTFESLDQLQQKFFYEKARELWKKEYALSQDQLKLVKSQTLYDNYALNIKIARPIIIDALNETKKYCNQYISTRDNFALLYSFRVQINTTQNNKDNKDNNKESKYKQQFNQEQDEQHAKMNLFMVTKYKNRGKLSSHNWFFNGFCQELNPEFAVLLDVGLVPQKEALWKMINNMKNNSKIGGVCGYMGLRIQKLDDKQQISDENIDCVTSLANKLFDIQRAQQFQYHFAHLIDKPFQSSFGFIHVLPGAFSAYRMEALKPNKNQDAKLLKQYFKSIDQSVASLNYKAQPFSIRQTICKVALPDLLYDCIYGKPNQKSYQQLLYNQNVYLAQDRTLCMGIHQNQFQLAYLPDAYAWVDPIKTLHGLLGQRKRWINGSFFAFAKVKQTLEQTGQKGGDCLLKLQIFYLSFMNMMSFIAPALFMYTIHIATETFQINVITDILQKIGIIPASEAARNYQVSQILVYIVDFIYVLIFLGLVFFSMNLTNRIVKFQSFFYGVSTTYGIFSIAVFGVLIYDIISGFSGKNTFLIENPWFVDKISGGEAMINSLRYIMLGIMGLYIIPVIMALVYCQCNVVIDIIFSTFSFLFYSPTYLNILNIYALCRMDDISWGTKGLDTQASGRNKQMIQEWKKIKLIHVSKFVLYNLIVGFLLILLGNDYQRRFWFTFAIMIILGLTLAIKVLLGTIYLIKYRCCNGGKISSQIIKDILYDPIEGTFKKVKQSLYEEVRVSIKQIGKQVKDNNKNIPIATAIFSSKIFAGLKFAKDGQGPKRSRFKKSSTNALSSGVDRLRSSMNSQMYKNTYNKNKQQEMVQSLMIEQQQQKTSDNNLNQKLKGDIHVETSTLQILENKGANSKNSKKRTKKAGL